MRVSSFIAAFTLLMAVPISAAQARNLSRQEVQVCRWGSEVAASAQHAKLSGKTLYSTRRVLLKRNYSQPWMRKMAVGITEQTFSSHSRAAPAAVGKSYYWGCVAHEKNRH
ncbi:hypothetical protein [Pseudomonas sp. NPDC007930]|uniref:hypothetical protein n=1 Tax=Pseudomonas sp. NPDC007930 TaxID=3364417 RepID=UPI0036E985DC